MIKSKEEKKYGENVLGLQKRVNKFFQDNEQISCIENKIGILPDGSIHDKTTECDAKKYEEIITEFICDFSEENTFKEINIVVPGVEYKTTFVEKDGMQSYQYTPKFGGNYPTLTESYFEHEKNKKNRKCVGLLSTCNGFIYRCQLCTDDGENAIYLDTSATMGSAIVGEVIELSKKNDAGSSSVEIPFD